MKHLTLFILFNVIGLPIVGQSIQSIFEWKTNAEVTTKSTFLPLFCESGIVESTPQCIIYDFKSYTLKSQQGNTYTLKLHSVNTPIPTHNYDGFSIFHQGKCILTYYTGDPLYNSEFITMGKSKDYFIQVPLDDNSFALCFGGWLYGIDDAPEMVIVVVSEGKAKVVFDNYAYAYNYTPPPAFSIEYVDEISGLYEQYTPTITPAFLKKRTKHRIWKEGNVLKYQSWK